MTTVKHSKDEELLISVAESIGSTLGSIAAKAAAVPQALADGAHSVETEGKAILKKSKTAARKGQKLVSKKISTGKKDLKRAFKKTMPRKKVAAKRKVVAAKKVVRKTVSKLKKKLRKR